MANTFKITSSKEYFTGTSEEAKNKEALDRIQRRRELDNKEKALRTLATNSETPTEVEESKVKNEESVANEETPVVSDKSVYDYLDEYYRNIRSDNDNGKTTKSVSTSTDSTANSDNRDLIYQKLIDRGLDENTAKALTIHIGAESTYNPNIKNPNSSAYGLGQWVAGNHSDIIDYINGKNHTAHTSITNLSLDDQIEAAAHWYYDNHKSALDSQSSVFDKVKYLAKIGFGPALLQSTGYKGTGKVGEKDYVYHDTDEDWLKYLHDTGHDKKNKYTTFDDHIRDRYKIAGYTV